MSSFHSPKKAAFDGGVYQFPFEFTLPDDLPPTFSTTATGRNKAEVVHSVRLQVTARSKKGTEVHEFGTRVFTAHNNEAMPMETTHASASRELKMLSLLRRGKLSLDVKLDCDVYECGKELSYHLTLHNHQSSIAESDLRCEMQLVETIFVSHHRWNRTAEWDRVVVSQQLAPLICGKVPHSSGRVTLPAALVGTIETIRHPTCSKCTRHLDVKYTAKFKVTTPFGIDNLSVDLPVVLQRATSPARTQPIEATHPPPYERDLLADERGHKCKCNDDGLDGENAWLDVRGLYPALAQA